MIERYVVGAEVAGRVSGQRAGKASDNVAALPGDLVGVGQVELTEVSQLGRAQGQFPGAHQRSIDGDGEVHVRLAEVGVIEEVVDAVFEVSYVEQPALVGDLQAELVLFVALARQRQ